MRDDLARPRSHFRIVEDGTLTQDYCLRCRGVLYQVPEGTWLHWSTLETECQREASQTVVDRPYGPAVGERGPYPGDTAERAVERAVCGASYRRPSWEWMSCR